MEDRIFPLTDRRAPILDRIRGDGEEASSSPKAIGKKVGKFFKNDDDEIEAEELARAVGEFREGLADELDVEPERITDEAMDKFAELLKMDNLVEDVVPEDESEDEEAEAEADTDFSVE